MKGGKKRDKSVISWDKLHWCVKTPHFYCLGTEERFGRGAGVFPDFHLHLSETVVDGSCYSQI